MAARGFKSDMPAPFKLIVFSAILELTSLRTDFPASQNVFELTSDSHLKIHVEYTVNFESCTLPS